LLGIGFIYEFITEDNICFVKDEARMIFFGKSYEIQNNKKSSCFFWKWNLYYQ